MKLTRINIVLLQIRHRQLKIVSYALTLNITNLIRKSGEQIWLKILSIRAIQAEKSRICRISKQSRVHNRIIICHFSIWIIKKIVIKDWGPLRFSIRIKTEYNLVDVWVFWISDWRKIVVDQSIYDNIIWTDFNNIKNL